MSYAPREEEVWEEGEARQALSWWVSTKQLCVIHNSVMAHPVFHILTVLKTTGCNNGVIVEPLE